MKGWNVDKYDNKQEELESTSNKWISEISEGEL